MRIFRLLASHPIFLFKLNKSGFDECYQSAIKWGFEKSKSQYFQGFAGPHIHFLLIPTRSCQKFSKQICLWDLVQGIGIIFIIQIVGAIWFFVAMVLPREHLYYIDSPSPNQARSLCLSIYPYINFERAFMDLHKSFDVSLLSSNWDEACESGLAFLNLWAFSITVLLLSTPV